MLFRSEAEVREVLSFSETVGSLAVIGVASLAGDEATAQKVLKALRERMGA